MSDDDDLALLDELLGGDPAAGESAPRRPEIRHQVVLLPEDPKLDAEAELDRVMPRILSDVVERVNVGVDEALPGTGSRYRVLGRRVVFEAEAPDVLDLRSESVAVDLNCKLAALAPAAEFQGPHLGSLRAGLQRYAAELVDAYTERERKKILAREVERRRQGPLQRLKDDDRKLVESATGELPVLGPADVDAVDRVGGQNWPT